MKNRKTTEKGSALVYILIAIALLAALTATFMDSSSQQTTSQNTFNTVTDLNSQINFIQECVLTFPGGDTTQISSNMPYPFNPDSGGNNPATGVAWLASAAGDKNVNGLRCPGNPGTSNNHTTIFGGASGKFLPPAPKLFQPWTYYNGTDGVFFYNSTSMSDAYLATSLQKLDDQFSECEADVIDNVGSAAALSLLSSGAAVTCPGYSLCFRVWLISQASANFAGDTDLDEAACP
jgi:hypothetical protein